jgi:hypothetical protein
MFFSLYPRVVVKLGDGERHIFDRRSLMFTEVQEIEKVTGQSYAEWGQQLEKYSITAVAALLHVLRRRDGMPSDFASMQFAVDDLDVIPLHDDDREFTPGEVVTDLNKRAEDATRGNGVGPTPAVAGPDAAPAADHPTTASTNRSLPNGSGSGRGNGTGSRTRTGSGARRTSTPS